MITLSSVCFTRLHAMKTTIFVGKTNEKLCVIEENASVIVNNRKSIAAQKMERMAFAHKRILVVRVIAMETNIRKLHTQNSLQLSVTHFGTSSVELP